MSGPLSFFRAVGPIGGLLLFAACTTGPQIEAAATCKSGQHWVGGESGSPQMHPGRDCIGCHVTSPDAPQLAVAGTVFPSNAGTDTDDCLGVGGAQVALKDRNGKVWTMQTNSAGNFYLDKADGTPSGPYTAKITWQGKTREMDSPQMSTACNSCHTATGNTGAPGRILLPE